MSAKRKMLRKANGALIKKRQREWRKGKRKPGFRKAVDLVKSITKKER